MAVGPYPPLALPTTRSHATFLFSFQIFLRRAQLPIADNFETRFRVYLLEQRDAVDRKLREFEPCKALAQHREHGFAARLVEPAGQRHMEAEFLHDVGI